jgi:hypothetical protein
MIKNNTMKKSVHQYKPDGTFLKSYLTITEAVKETGIPRKRIRFYAQQTPPKILKEKIIFSFIKLDKLPIIDNISTNKKKLYVYHANGLLFKVFNSISEGTNYTNISYKRIIRSINKKVPTVLDSKYIFSFEPLNLK